MSNGTIAGGRVKGACNGLAARPSRAPWQRSAKIDSPRGAWTLSKAHNPIQDHYLRKVRGNENRVSEIAVKALDDDPTMSVACKMPA